MTPTLNDQITAIEERAAKSTPGNWEYREGHDNGFYPVYSDLAVGIFAPHNAAFIAAARSDIPALCKLARAQDEALRGCVEALKEIQFQESLKRKPYPYADMIEAALAAAERLDGLGGDTP